MKTLIVGLSKSGTTGLYYKIKNSITGEVEGIFERNELEKKLPLLQSDKNIVTKLLLFPDYLQQGYYNNVVNLHDKKVLIIRDPRDNMVSELLYIGGYHVTWEKSSHVRREKIKLLKEKERNPRNISLVELFNSLCDRPPDKLKEYTVQRFDSAVNFANRYPDFYILYYEDFVHDYLDKLESYLGFILKKKVEVDIRHTRVIRTKTSGNWINWYTQDDIEFFKPLMQNYIDKFGYGTLDWELNVKPTIPSKHSSKYFTKLINDKRRSFGKETLLEKILRKIFR